MPPNPTPTRQEQMVAHGAMATMCVDPEEHLASAAADMVQTLAQKKCPGDYPP